MDKPFDKFVVNGKEMNYQEAQTTDSANLGSSQTDTYIGGNGGSRYWDGEVDEVDRSGRVSQKRCG